MSKLLLAWVVWVMGITIAYMLYPPMQTAGLVAMVLSLVLFERKSWAEYKARHQRDNQSA